ncbi:superoxide dismutase family protein [Stenotrophomonas maltophilia]|uniref:superoxide dismutase family protein n=1 Tax=Stenotrophomonas maltophilia TaxID=40324 RepID=UPI0028A1DE23|nr:superoxide dismutase family protein [Stenotrophomonas maltophilia]
MNRPHDGAASRPLKAALGALVLGCLLAGPSLAHAASATAKVDLKPTAGNTAAGTVRFKQQDGLLEIDADVSGLSPGPHGFHLHEKGDCSAPGATSAGGHFNPENHPHAGPDYGTGHAGDFGNIIADASGRASLRLSVPTSQISLDKDAANGIIGRGVIVHADADDMVTQVTGNAGKRVACGVVVVEKRWPSVNRCVRSAAGSRGEPRECKK